ncbi:hypothetical protein NP233_g11580 [Leucocoprinus birnbaumii]|uniref:HTH CENPB-type domain-containing protein n=1 Tax=Leucocoprinus birnbaumii TaxID=56174 RepID=A0AAD5VIN0_9AGAR|nr:hypothetical protein NP233_g11580 [Leucocoprinus birnbaumii]
MSSCTSLIPILEKGLAKLEKQLNPQKSLLEKALSSSQKISEADTEWLDNEANLADAAEVITYLKENAIAMDLGSLDEARATFVQRLREAAGNLPKSVGNKRKHGHKGLTNKESGSRNEGRVSSVQLKKAKLALRKKRVNATLAQNIEVLDWLHGEGENNHLTAISFSLGEDGGEAMRPTEHPEITEMMDLWVACAMAAKSAVLTGDLIRRQWEKFADLAGIPEEDRLKLSKGWLSCFKKRNGLREIKGHGEAGSVKKSEAVAEQQRIKKVLSTMGYSQKDIFNMDETGLFYVMPPDQGLADKAKPGIKGWKICLTYVFTVNVDGSEKHEALIIGKPKQPQCFQRKTAAQLGFLYCNNAKAWMTTIIYQEWLHNWDEALRIKRFPDDLQNICVINFAPNLTSHVQPLDQGIIRCFKAHYHKLYLEQALKCYEMGVTPSEVYDIDQLEAMQLACIAWSEVDTQTLRNCWRKANILPIPPTSTPIQPTVPISALLDDSNAPMDSDSTPTMTVEQEVEGLLDELESTGILHKHNRMSLDALLNPANEEGSKAEGTEEEIYSVVMESCQLHEMIEINGGDNSDNNNAGSTVQPPIRCKDLFYQEKPPFVYLDQ